MNTFQFTTSHITLTRPQRFALIHIEQPHVAIITRITLDTLSGSAEQLVAIVVRPCVVNLFVG
jgi:hypothetical protein